MITGPTISEIKKEIRLIITVLPDVLSVFGFGSYFRSLPFNDVDILVVLKPECISSLEVYYKLQASFSELSDRLGFHIDFTVLTSKEFLERPLLEMDSLVSLFP